MSNKDLKDIHSFMEIMTEALADLDLALDLRLNPDSDSEAFSYGAMEKVAEMRVIAERFAARNASSLAVAEFETWEH